MRFCFRHKGIAGVFRRRGCIALTHVHMYRVLANIGDAKAYALASFFCLMISELP